MSPVPAFTLFKGIYNDLNTAETGAPGKGLNMFQ